ncbi:MAG: hypothetical protein U9R15_08640 [Chloroflexota bacterium]|nr:hypothetical protein [Chloroflexota bacterium]
MTTTIRTTKSGKERTLERLLTQKGLTRKQVQSGLKYYRNMLDKFEKYHENPELAVTPILRNIENMKAGYSCQV